MNASDFHFSRCQIVPQAGEQVSLQIDGSERLRWHFGAQYPRPFFFPLNGPSGASLTRMGHPGAPNHDHHRSVWFAHAKVLGIDFWSDRTDARIRQQHWYSYIDGDREAVMAVSLGWFDAHDPRELLTQDLVAAIRPVEGHPGETLVELQSTLRPTSATLELGQTNFGLLAVRLAKSISSYFGGGQITSSAGKEGEEAIFGQPAHWMDYSGPVQNPLDPAQQAIEGITYFDHPDNPGYPARWHVREDGWMGASLCREQGIELAQSHPLVVRYLLHAHAGPINSQRAEVLAQEFAKRQPFVVEKGTARHHQFAVHRAPEN